jgi:hypothetical protein
VDNALAHAAHHEPVQPTARVRGHGDGVGAGVAQSGEHFGSRIAAADERLQGDVGLASFLSCRSARPGTDGDSSARPTKGTIGIHGNTGAKLSVASVGAIAVYARTHQPLSVGDTTGSGTTLASQLRVCSNRASH